MLTTCLFCHRRFPSNDVLEWLPVGRRVAFDPRQGRLWAVCPSCGRWTLAPLEERWEALEELERLCRDQGRLLARTDHIGLLAAGALEMVRVGRADLQEESWWRFGREIEGRRQRAKRVVRRGKLVDAAVLLVMTGIPLWGLSDPERWLARARKREFGTRLAGARGLSACDRCGASPEEVDFGDYPDLALRPGPAGAVGLAVPCFRCAARGDEGWHRLDGMPAEHALRRTLAYRNFAGGSEALVRSAVGLVESSGSSRELVTRVAEQRTRLGALTDEGAYALEIALSHDVERRLLAMELEELETRWRQEEAIAAIADAL